MQSIHKYKSTTKKNNRHIGKSGRLLWIVVGLLIVWLFFTGPRSIFKLISATFERSKLEKEIKELEERKVGLDSLKENLQNPYEIEKKAREEYNMKKPGERVYKVQGK